MKTLNFIRRTGTDGDLHLTIPVKVPNSTVEITVVMNVINNDMKKHYNFDDLAGRLTWKGNAVKEQRRLRDEW